MKSGDGVNEKAVEAAAKALCPTPGAWARFPDKYRGEARAVLEAARPEIVAEVVEALRGHINERQMGYFRAACWKAAADKIAREFGVSP